RCRKRARRDRRPGTEGEHMALDDIRSFNADPDADDNTAQIQAALDSGLASVFIPTGRFRTRALTKPDTVKLIHGPGTLVANGTIAAFGTFLLCPGSSDFTISDVNIDVDPGFYPSVNSIALVNCTDTKVQDVKFANAGRFAVYVGGCTRTAVERCVIKNFTQ